VLGRVDPTPEPPRLGPRRFACPFCHGLDFASERGLQGHLAACHVGAEPRLILAGRVADTCTTVRQPCPAGSLQLTGCTDVELRVNGGPWRQVRAEEVGDLLTFGRDADIDLRLLNAFEQSAVPISRTYEIRLRIPDRSELHLVDEAFVEHLARDDVSMDRVARFLETAPASRPGREYAEALAAYVRGVLVKDRAPGDRISLPVDEYRSLYGAAYEALRAYDRPLARMICGVVAFSRNAFHGAVYPTLIPPLDELASRLAAVLGDRLDTPRTRGGTEGKVPICPIDQGLERVLKLASRLDEAGRWGTTLEEECRQAAAALTLDTADRIKVYVVWALAALRLGDREAATEPLAEIAQTEPFADWAVQQLEGNRS